MIRVVGGTAKGVPLKMPGGGKTRPAMSRVKESVFAILANKIWGARVLDLFAGSGSVGIEALSRGAKFAVFVDNSLKCVQTIYANLQKTGFKDRAQVFCEDCLRFIKKCELEPFDLVFIDPPYHKGFLEPILDFIPVSPIFSLNTIFIIERQKKDSLRLENKPAVVLLDEREYGDTTITFFKLVATYEKIKT